MTREPLHVVHVTEVLGGVETYLRLMVDHWKADHVRFTFVLPSEDGLADHLRERGHSVFIAPIPRTRWRMGEFRSARLLRRLFKVIAPDIVHLHSSQAGLVGRLACLGSRRPVVYTPHAYYFLGQSGVARQLFRIAEIFLARVTPTYVLATSPSEAHRARRDVRTPPNRVSALLNAVELTCSTAREAGRPFKVGLVARVSEQKNHRMFFRVARRLEASCPSTFAFHLVGVGHYSDDLQRLSRLLEEEGVTSLMTVTPWMNRDDLLQWLGTCDAVVLTSVYESFGYTLAEATARAVPVIGTDVDGIRDVVRDGVNGHLVPVDDHDTMAERLMGLQSDPEHYRCLSQGALDTAADRLAIQQFVGWLADYYEGLRPK